MKDNLVFQKYQRSKNIRSANPVVRVNRGYFFFNRRLLESLECEMIDLYVNADERTVLIKPGKDFKLTMTAYGRATFSAAHFINELQIRDGFYPARDHDEGMIFSYRTI